MSAVAVKPSPVQFGTLPTMREREVLALIAEGLDTAEIGERLFLAPDTIKTHVARILRKLGARNRAHAVHIGHGFGLRGAQDAVALRRERAELEEQVARLRVELAQARTVLV